ncbi:MAG: hypothetical protein GXY61_00285 [Lentisphaerae bacterium]|jgi:hypothetical protein|nr:hypothetical protein [Lentisphaerota bacterium]
MKIIQLLVLVVVTCFCGCAHTVRIIDEDGNPLEGVILGEAVFGARTPPLVMKFDSNGEYEIEWSSLNKMMIVSKDGYEPVIFYACDKPKVITLKKNLASEGKISD